LDFVIQFHVAAVKDPTNMEQNVATPEDSIPNDDKTPTEETGYAVGGEEKSVQVGVEEKASMILLMSQLPLNVTTVP